uniref:Transforming growth factor beta receptor type 3-like isoform X1 n=1 Tax=Saccoglossus kowalevskii TaxID=10224 RepID=A0ABM0MA01_SACKO|nr:PREDICTED: transforming growth factor beta receptor type 3-like isoform X1 [Saccoglossus kowalevskii]XP_006816842.1 PREDICTED: transforming growth factor beta receptor type 3-like isoform X2 [Saccoglossus kowalevskii]
MKTVWLPCVIFAQLGFILGSLATRTCTPTSPFESQYLTPMCRQYLVGSGCYSSSVTTLQQEVHTIHVKNEDNLQRAEISLQIRPAADTGVYDKQLVFVLSSEIPVEWKVELLRLSLDFEIIFHVTRGSDVNYSEDRTITVIKKRHMPTVNDKLVRWIRRKYHALTSFTEIQKANKITLRVGAETMLSENCNIRSNFYSPNVVAEFLKVQPVTSGCAPHPVGSRAIHIIEANDSCVDGDTINLHVESQGREMYSNNVMIIIKSNVNTNWRVTSENFTGSLHIITNVDKMMLDDSPWQPDSSYEQTALESGAKLIRWAEKEHGPVNSFTETNNANLLRLQLKEDIVALPASETLMPEMIPKSPLDGDFNASDLMRSFTKECRDDGINVALQKDVLELFDVRFLSLSFLDHNCKAESNETHFILSTQFINCGTKKDIRDNRVVFKNAIVISDGEFTIEGSGWDFSDGSASGEILTDDEDMQILKIEFSCDYTTGPLQPVATRKPPLSFEITNYTLKLFDKYFYEQPHTEFPWLIEEDTRIYAQVGLEGALDLTFGVVPYGCWLSPTAENTRDVVTNELITNGCASDSSVLIEEFIPNDIIGTLPGSQKMPGLSVQL